MRKSLGIVAGFAALALIFVPMVPVNAYKADAVKDGAITVSSAADLEQALDDTTVNTITLDRDIESQYSILIDRPLTLDGANHKITVTNGEANDNVGGHTYAIKVYNVNGDNKAVIKNVSLDGGVGAISNQGSNIVLQGNITFGDHVWGGMEIDAGSQGLTSTVDYTAATISYASEDASHPAIWSDNAQASAKYDGIHAARQVGTKLKLYLNAKNAPAVDAEAGVVELPVDEYRVTPIADEQQPAPETPEVTEPVEDKTPATDEGADVTAPNTGAMIANASLVVLGIAVAVLTAIYAARFANARK